MVTATPERDLIDNPWIHTGHTGGETLSLRAYDYVPLFTGAIVEHPCVDVMECDPWWLGRRGAARTGTADSTLTHLGFFACDNASRRAYASAVQYVVLRIGRALLIEFEAVAAAASSPLNRLSVQHKQALLNIYEQHLAAFARQRPLLTCVDAISALRVDEMARCAFTAILADDTRTTDPSETAPESCLDPVKAGSELRRLLGITYKDLESITGIAKRSFHYWNAEEVRPWPATVRKLIRAYALVCAVASKLGEESAALWFREGSSSPLDRMLAGDLDSAEDAAHALLFRDDIDDHDHRIGSSPFVPELDFDVDASPPATPLRRAERSPTRGRLSTQ